MQPNERDATDTLSDFKVSSFHKFYGPAVQDITSHVIELLSPAARKIVSKRHDANVVTIPMKDGGISTIRAVLIGGVLTQTHEQLADGDGRVLSTLAAYQKLADGINALVELGAVGWATLGIFNLMMPIEDTCEHRGIIAALFSDVPEAVLFNLVNDHTTCTLFNEASPLSKIHKFR